MNLRQRATASFRAAPAWLAHAVGPVLVVVLVLALAALAIASDHARSRERAIVQAHNVARLVEAQLSDNLDKVDIYLQLMALRHADRLLSGGVAAVAAALTPQQLALIDLEGLKLADASGAVRLRVGSMPVPPEQVGTQEFFRRAVADPQGRLVVAAMPADSGRQLVLARAVRDAQGGVRGVVFAAMAAAQFSSLFEGVALGTQGLALLRGDDLLPVLEHPVDAARADGVPAALRQALAVAPGEGVYESAATPDAPARIHSYRRLRAQPFYVEVGMSTQQVMAPWRANAWLVAALAAVTVALALWAWWMQQRWSRRQLQVLHSRYEAIVQTSSDSIVSKDLEGRIGTWNRGAQQMFGYTAGEMLGHSAARLVPPERRGEDDALIARVLRGESLQAYETQRLRKDGLVIDVAMAVSPVLDGRGRIAGVSVIARDISRHKAMEAEIRAMAFNDPLTRLPNRRLLMDRLRQAQLSSHRQRSYFGVLFIDLDGFKRINDSFGHEVGDQLLIEIGRRLQSAVRQHDTVARLGGDEFVVLLEELGADEKTAADHVNTVADKILDAIERAFHLRGELHRCSASIGIRLIVGSQDAPEQVLMEADAAMYSVKRQRRALRSFAFE